MNKNLSWVIKMTIIIVNLIIFIGFSLKQVQRENLILRMREIEINNRLIKWGITQFFNTYSRHIIYIDEIYLFCVGRQVYATLNKREQSFGKRVCNMEGKFFCNLSTRLRLHMELTKWISPYLKDITTYNVAPFLVYNILVMTSNFFNW